MPLHWISAHNRRLQDIHRRLGKIPKAISHEKWSGTCLRNGRRLLQKGIHIRTYGSFQFQRIYTLWSYTRADISSKVAGKFFINNKYSTLTKKKKFLVGYKRNIIKIGSSRFLVTIRIISLNFRANQIGSKLWIWDQSGVL